MPRHALRAALAAVVVLVLSGCVRYSSSYTIQSDDTVDGTIFVTLKEGYQNEEIRTTGPVRVTSPPTSRTRPYSRT